MLDGPTSKKPGDAVLCEVRHHAGTQSLSPKRQCAEEKPKHCNANHLTPALVCVRPAKNQCLQHGSAPCGIQSTGELLLEISTEDYFFTKPCSHAQYQPGSHLPVSVGEHRADTGLHIFHMSDVVHAEQEPCRQK